MRRAKANLLRLVQKVKNGTEPEVIIAVRGKPAARLVPVASAPRRTLGIDHDLVVLAEDFDQGGAEIAALFEGNES